MYVYIYTIYLYSNNYQLIFIVLTFDKFREYNKKKKFFFFFYLNII